MDDQYRLMAGGRRLRAVRLLGWQTMPVRLYGTLSEQERREIELEENERRLDLTPYERSKQFMQEVQQKVEQVRQEPEPEPEPPADSPASDPHEEPERETGFVSTQIQNPGGRPKSAKREAAAQIGVKPMEVTRTEQHIETAEKYPFMQGREWTRYNVLEARKHLNAMREDDQERASRMVCGGMPTRSATRTSLVGTCAGPRLPSGTVEKSSGVSLLPLSRPLPARRGCGCARRG